MPLTEVQRLKRNEYQRNWRHRYPEKFLAYSRRYAKTHAVQIREYRRKYYRQNPAKFLAVAKRWRAEHPQYVHDLYRKNLGGFRDYQKKWKHDNVWRLESQQLRRTLGNEGAVKCMLARIADIEGRLSRLHAMVTA